MTKVIKLIITKLIGGLGNQMFQYAIGRRLALAHNTMLKLDITGFRDYKLWSYYLNHFNIIENIATENEINDLKNRRYIRQRFFHFDSSLLKLDSDAYLEGYWQSEKYFQDIEDIIREEFVLKHSPSNENRRLIHLIEESNAVAVHIRRGDYLSNAAAYQFHGICPLTYYYKAVAELTKEISKPHFFIFSDDLFWTQENFKINFPITFATINGPHQGYEDLRLMSLCKYHVIANSSFSWWGAWLSQYPGKIVYTPKEWFNDKDINTDDLIPKTWRLI
jgi:hypothetical protein